MIQSIKEKKVALITGITGQDGPYLASFLLSKDDYVVFGSYRRTCERSFFRLNSLGILENKNFYLIEMDITDTLSIINCIEKVKPDEFYNLAGQSYVGLSYEQPHLTIESCGTAVLNILNCIKLKSSDTKKIKFYQASTSEMFGNNYDVDEFGNRYQSEITSFIPCSPYGSAKLLAHNLVRNYRDAYSLHVSTGILFNHESPLRGSEFVTKKITQSVAKIKLNKMDYFKIGNINSKRDWGYAKDYVEAMWLILQQEEPNDYVIASERAESVRTFIELAFKEIDVEIEWQRNLDDSEKGVDKKSGITRVVVDQELFRPNDVNDLKGNCSKAKRELNWKSKTSLEELIKIMINFDIKEQEKLFDKV